MYYNLTINNTFKDNVESLLEAIIFVQHFSNPSHLRFHIRSYKFLWERGYGDDILESNFNIMSLAIV